MSENVCDWDFSRECLQFSLSVTVLDKVTTCFRARTQMFLWSSVIFFSAIKYSWLLQFLCLLDTVIVIDSFSMFCRRKKNYFA